MDNNRNVKKKKAADTQENENTIVNRMMIVFCTAVIAVVALLMIGNGGPAERIFVLNILPFMKIAGLVLLAAALVWYFVRRGKIGKINDGRIKIVTPQLLLTSSAVFCVSMLVYTQAGVVMVVSGIIAVTVAAFVYHFYQRDFFWFTVVSIFGAAGLAALSKFSTAWIVTAAVTASIGAVGAVVAALTIIVILMLKMNGGRKKIGKNEIVMKPGYLYLPFVISPVIILLGSVASFFIPAVSVYAIFAVLAVYLVYAIIYTVKMM